MFERSTIKAIGRSAMPRAFQFSDSFIGYTNTYDFQETSSYEKGVEDGRKDMEVELLKRGKALYQLAFQKVSYVTNKLLEESEKHGINIIEIHLKVENWDCAESIILVKLQDYLDDKIDSLYNFAQSLAEEINDDNFHWNYSITYHSDSVNKEKIISDGFHYVYEHTPTSRQTQ